MKEKLEQIIHDLFMVEGEFLMSGLQLKKRKDWVEFRKIYKKLQGIRYELQRVV